MVAFGLGIAAYFMQSGEVHNGFWSGFTTPKGNQAFCILFDFIQQIAFLTSPCHRFCHPFKV